MHRLSDSRSRAPSAAAQRLVSPFDFLQADLTVKPNAKQFSPIEWPEQSANVSLPLVCLFVFEVVM